MRHVDLDATKFRQGWRSLKRRHRWRLIRDVATLAFGVSLLVMVAVLLNLYLKGR